TWDTFGLATTQGGPPAGYIGNPNVPHRVVGSPKGNNLFRIKGKSIGGPGIDEITTNLFTLEGRIAGLSVIAAPGGGLFKASQSVRLAASDLAAKVFYTIDGTDPVASTTRSPYSSPLSIGTDTTLKFVAEIAGSGGAAPTRSPIGSETYTFDMIAPSVVASPAA